MSIPTSLSELGEELDGAVLLDELHATLGRYVAFPSRAAQDAVTLLIAATHGQPAFDTAPRGAFVSPEKRCGKSRLLDVVAATCYRPLLTSNVSIAALVHSICEDDPPTILVDEADAIFGTRKAADSNEDLRGILNAGHQRGRPYVRWDVTSRTAQHCPTFAIAILASIGDLPDTIMDRAVVVRMRRRAAGERVNPFRMRRDSKGLEDLRDRLSAWVRGHLEELEKAEPSMPVEDRAADTWEPLVAVADLAGGEWPKRARDACLFMVAEMEEDASLGTWLLADVRSLFGEHGNRDFIPSKALVEALVALDDAPWADRNLSANRLARMLKPYGVRPRQDAAKNMRGYYRADLADAFTRYLPEQREEHEAADR